MLDQLIMAKQQLAEAIKAATAANRPLVLWPQDDIYAALLAAPFQIDTPPKAFTRLSPLVPVTKSSLPLAAKKTEELVQIALQENLELAVAWVGYSGQTGFLAFYSFDKREATWLR